MGVDPLEKGRSARGLCLRVESRVTSTSVGCCALIGVPPPVSRRSARSCRTRRRVGRRAVQTCPVAEPAVHEVPADEHREQPEPMTPHAIATMLEIFAPKARSASLPAEPSAFITTAVQLPDSSDHSSVWGRLPRSTPPRTPRPGGPVAAIAFATRVVDTADGPTVEVESLHLVVGHSRQIAVHIVGRGDPDEEARSPQPTPSIRTSTGSATRSASQDGTSVSWSKSPDTIACDDRSKVCGSVA